jgi:hypothetical protein
MDQPRTSRYTIREIMIVIALFACLLGLPRLIASLDPLGLYLVAAPMALLLLNFLVEMVAGFPCPSCSRWALRRLARHRHYFRCSACRGRFKRVGFGPWLDASGPEDAAKFRKPTEAGTWKGFEVPEELDGTTSGHLLRNKRSGEFLEREMRRPHQPGSGRRLEEAEDKVRAFLAHLRDARGS